MDGDLYVTSHRMGVIARGEGRRASLTGPRAAGPDAKVSGAGHEGPLGWCGDGGGEGAGPLEEMLH